ncbi:hypothetical protein [Argonema galeatum]|nr:hypothetical protein [Argonema galeatum]
MAKVLTELMKPTGITTFAVKILLEKDCKRVYVFGSVKKGDRVK